jgi:hypothetical protein
MTKKKKPNCYITKAQLGAIIDDADNLSGMVGVGSDFDQITIRIVKLIDRFLKSNGIKRRFN